MNHHCQIGKITFKPGKETPGKTLGLGLAYGYFKRLSLNQWGRIALIDYVRMTR